MMDKFNKLLMKKKDEKPMDDVYKNSKMSVLQELRDQMSGLMKDDLHGAKIKKVEVASNDKEGLAQGLDKAKDMLGHMPEEHEADESEDSPEEESSESPEEKVEEIAQDASDEDLDAMIKKLEEMKQHKKMGMV